METIRQVKLGGTASYAKVWQWNPLVTRSSAANTYLADLGLIATVRRHETRVVFP